MSHEILTIGEATWELTGTIPDPDKLFIRGTGEGGIDIPSTKATISGSVISINNAVATQAFPSQTKYYNPFTITWEVSFDGGDTWQAAGTSKNVIYVCLYGEKPDNRYRTMVHLACSKDGASTVDQAVSNSWDLIKGRNVCKWNQATESYDVPLYYYRPGTSFDPSENPVTVGGLLRVTSGECIAWAHLLQDAWTLNGAKENQDAPESSFYTIAAPNQTLYRAFWVKDWGKIPASTCFFEFQSSEFDMIPYPPSGQYGYYDDLGINLKNERTIPGQNSGGDAPSQKVFGNHQFVKYKKADSTFAYYDPSYGVTYNGTTKAQCEADFQSKALVGFGKPALLQPSPTKLRYIFFTKTATVQVVFNH